jgi:transcription termination factor Rho
MTSSDSDKEQKKSEKPEKSDSPSSSGPDGSAPKARLSRPRLRSRVPRTKVSRGNSNSGQSNSGQSKSGQREGGSPQSQGGGRKQRPDRNNNRRSDHHNHRPNDRMNQGYEEEPEITGTEPPLSINELNKKSLTALMEVAKEKEIEGSRMSKQELVFAILKKHGLSKNRILGDGVVEILQDGFGFLRNPQASYQPGPCDIYISPPQIKRFSLRTGDTVSGTLRAPKDNERYFALVKVEEVNFSHPDNAKRIQPFEDLTPLFPTDMLNLEVGNGSTEDITARIIDLVSPIGKGQRGLIVSPPKAGKTMMMQNIAHSLAANHPDCKLIVLLVDERPEEVTEMTRSVRGEVVASTFDEPASRHVQVAEIVIEKAKRLVEQGHDVIVLLDSITRLARAYNTVAPSSGKVLTGGVDAAALQRPKRFFGAARNIENGASLTIIATALVETGSKMDEVIFEEFKGTGNMEAHLERRIAEKRVFPAINIRRSGTRREELMMTPAELKKRWIIRKVLHPMDEIGASEFLLDRLKRTKTNEDFFGEMKK